MEGRILAAGQGAILAGLLILGGRSLAQNAVADGPSTEIPALGARLVAGAETAYVSDYVSFSGRDELGLVAFALDTNRGVADGEHQAEHFVVLFDETRGWVDIEGYESFPNPAGILLGYPESPFFAFTGEPYALESIASKSAPLTLSIGQLDERVTRHDDATVFSLASGPGTLVWEDRRIEGRVIYEYLAMRDANRLAGASVGSVFEILTAGPDFQGLYLASEDGGDLYVHLAHSSAASGLGEPLMAFATHDGATQRIGNLIFEVTDFDPAAGFYRWPGSWAVTWQSDCGQVDLEVETLSHATQTNWVVGGFGMRAVRGSVSCADRAVPVFGFAELIR